MRQRSVRILLFCLLSLSLISWDRVTKDLAKEHLRNKPQQSYLNGLVRLQYVENTGAAMSLADNINPRVSFWLLAVLPLGVILGFYGYTVRHIQEMRAIRIVSISLVLAGGLGNILDRFLFDRHVTDFINIRLSLLGAGIFNFADVWITVGVLCFLLSLALPKTQPA